MSTEQNVLAGIHSMQHKIERLETRIDEMHAIFEHMLLVVPPVVFTLPDGSRRPFRPNRPVSPQTLVTMAKVEELSRERRHLSAKERTELFLQNMEQARAEAIRKGIAIDDEQEAAIDD